MVIAGRAKRPLVLTGFGGGMSIAGRENLPAEATAATPAAALVPPAACVDGCDGAAVAPAVERPGSGMQCAASSARMRWYSASACAAASAAAAAASWSHTRGPPSGVDAAGLGGGMSMAGRWKRVPAAAGVARTAWAGPGPARGAVASPEAMEAPLGSARLCMAAYRRRSVSVSSSSDDDDESLLPASPSASVAACNSAMAACRADMSLVPASWSWCSISVDKAGDTTCDTLTASKVRCSRSPSAFAGVCPAGATNSSNADASKRMFRRSLVVRPRWCCTLPAVVAASPAPPVLSSAMAGSEVPCVRAVGAAVCAPRASRTSRASAASSSSARACR